jgi:uncharacterized membrane protein
MDEQRTPAPDSMGLPIRFPEPGKRHGFLGFLRSRLVTGLLVAFPLVVTIFFGRFLFGLVDRWTDPISLYLFQRRIPGVGTALFVLLIFVLGVLGHNVLGRRILRIGDRIFARIPILRSIYLGTREVTRAFAGDRAKSFRRVVLIPFPNEGVWAIAFVTGEFDETTPEGPRHLISVFMPTTPNPTTGFFLVYPEDSIRPTGLSVEEALRLVISGGLVSAAQDRVFPGARTGPGELP